MQNSLSLRTVHAALALTLVASAASAQIRLTEYSSNPSPEWFELRNFSNITIDTSGWSYDDESRTPGLVLFNTFGVGNILAGEVVIFTEIAPATFRAQWNIPASVRIFGPVNSNNLSSGGDEINIFDASGTLVDRLTYTAGTAAIGASRNILAQNIGQNNADATVTSVSGDGFGSYTNTLGRVGNPGIYVPTPGAALLAAAGGLLAARRRR